LLVTVENYPNLKANAGFQDLRTQLEGTENRIGIARNRYIKSVEDFNTFIRQLPQNLTAMVFGQAKPQFAVENEAAINPRPSISARRSSTSRPQANCAVGRAVGRAVLLVCARWAGAVVRSSPRRSCRRMFPVARQASPRLRRPRIGDRPLMRPGRQPARDRLGGWRCHRGAGH
jgi:hypothetical protein